MEDPTPKKIRDTFPDLPDDFEGLFFRSLMEKLPFSIYFKDRASRFIRVSNAMAKKFRTSPEAMIGMDDSMEFGPVHAAEALADEVQVMESGLPILNKEEREDHPDGSISWAKTTKIPLVDDDGKIIGTFGASNDITKRILAEQALRRERKLLRTLIDMLPFRVFIKNRDGRYLLSNAVHCATLGVSDDRELIGKTILDFRPDDGGRRSEKRDRYVIESGEPLFDKEQPDLLNPGQNRWVISSRMPIKDPDGKVEGLVGVSIDITKRKHAEIDLLERDQRMREELDVARKLQEALLPASDQVDGAHRVRGTDPFQIGFHYQPCEQLAGDFIHLIRIDDHRIGLLIADVMGHGVRAALVTSMIAGLVRKLEPLGNSPGRFMTELNRGVSSMIQNTRSFLFATAFYAVIDERDRSISCCNAGHCAPICVGIGGSHPLQSQPGPALVLNPDYEYVECVRTAHADCRLFFFTDGIVEAVGPDGNEWGRERLIATLESTRNLDLCQQIAATIANLKTFSEQDHFDDDLCLIGVAPVPS